MKLPRSRHSLLATALVVAAFCAPQVGSIASQPLAPAPKASASIAVRAAGRGNPYVNLGDAVGLLPRYSGHRAAAAQLEAGTARPLALATADFDKDGVPDVIASWEAAGSSSVSLHRASFDARHPYSEQARRHREEGTFVGERFMPEAAVFEIPEPAELMAAGDFDADGNQDLAAASRHAKSLTVLHGDGAGGFRPPESLELPGTLTALAAVDFNRRDGYEDLLAAVVGPDGARLLVYQSYEGALQAEPEAIPLPAPATAIAIGRLDTHPLRDLVVTAGDRLVLVPGRDRRLYATGRIREQADKLSVQEVELPGPAESVAVGDFDGDVKDDIAVRLAGGVLWVRLAADPDKPQSMSLPGGPAEGENAARLVTAAVSSRPGRSLLLMEPSARRLRLLMPEKGGPAPEPIDLEVAGRPVAVLPIYLNGDGLSDLVVLSEAPASLSVSESMPLTTLTVTTVGDLGLGTLRNAIANANTLPGADTIVFNIPGAGPHTITPSIGGPLPAVTETLTIDASAELLPSGAPGVVLSGSSCGDCDGLTLNTQDTIVRALAINNFSNSGVRIEGGTNNRVQACFLGVAPDGTTAAGNRDGVNTASTNVPLVGGGSADGNLISGNSSRGVRMLFGTIDGVVQSCTIGTTRNGVSPLPNVGGVDLSGDDAGVAFNTLSGNSTSGVIIDDGRFNLVRFNVIGTDPSGLLAVSNQFEGVLLSSADNNDVLQNRISGNTPGSGVHLIGSTGNLVRQNLIGLRASDPPGPLPNNEGILIEAAQDNMLSSNFISGNLGPGVWLRALASGNEVTGNWIGIGDDLVTPMANNSGVRFTGDSWNNIVSGNLVVYNSDDGILVSESPGNKILGNTVSGNTDAGIQITGAGSSGNLLETNRIGTDEAGIAALPNLRGVVIDAGASGNEVGASNTGNLISGNSGPGVLITGSMSTGNRVIENLIGTDVTGTAPLGNGTGVLIVAGANNFVGGLNVISANGNNLVIDSAGGIPAGNRVTNNYLGTDISGTAPLGTGGDNVVLNDSQAVMLIGNIIGGNHTRGLRISGGGFNEVHGNDFGVGPSGGPIGLSGPGISIENGSVGNLIGNGLPGGENVIANNNGNGIQVLDTGLDNDIRRNSIHSNAGLAIDLGNDGVTANDNQDQDAGPNTRQNFPSLTAASTSSGDMAIQGTLHSTPGANFTLEFYASPTCDPSGHGEGARYLGSGNAATLVDGTSLPYSFNFMRAVSPSEFITATARLIATPGDTSGSEFSACLLPSTTTPIDVSPTMAMAPGETEMMWGPVAGAQSYTLYRGLPADLEHLPATTPATLQGVPNACTRWSGTTPTTGPILTEEPPPGSFFWYLVSATGIYGEGGVGAGSLGPRQILSSGPCTGSFCPHDKCMQGDPLSTNCGGCVASICAVDPYCCNTAWDNICVGEVRTVCNNFTCLESAGSCNHTLCSFGPTLTSGCDVPPLSAGCVAQICAVDPYCCDEHWDAICINEVTTICGKQCD